MLPDSPPRSTTAVTPLLGSCSVMSGSLLGLELQPIVIEVASRRGPSSFQLAGLAEAAVREARVRVQSALSRLGIALEEYSLTVSLAPADVRKSGSGHDVALALAILGAIGHLAQPLLPRAMVLGELSLDGSVRPIRGVLPLLEGARRLGLREAYVPKGNSAEAAYVSALDVFAVDHLEELLAALQGRSRPTPLRRAPRQAPSALELDLLDVRGQHAAKRALEVGAAGGHHLLLIGPPGAGKSILARRLPGLLPPLDDERALETTAVHSVAGLVDPARGIVDTPPFRAPHHTVSDMGLIGGGSIPRPGEVSLAHNGVLFLDELPEFRRSTLETLRQPLEEGSIHIVRARERATFPARPLLIGAMNPCPCGHYGDPRRACRCSVEQRLRYLGRLSGPLLDRIDVQVFVPPLELSDWTRNREDGESSRRSGERVAQARALQARRQRSGEVRARANAQLCLDELERIATPDDAGRRLLEDAVESLGLSARGYVRVLRVARTLADLEGTDAVRASHVGEALRGRVIDPLAQVASR